MSWASGYFSPSFLEPRKIWQPHNVACHPRCSQWPHENPHPQTRLLLSWSRCCCPGSGSGTHPKGGNRSVGVFRHKEGFLLFSPWDRSSSGPLESSGTTEVSCFDRLQHGLLLCRTWKECMGSVDSSTWADPHTHFSLRCTGWYWWRCHAHHWQVHHTALQQNKHRNAICSRHVATMQTVYKEKQCPADPTDMCSLEQNVRWAVYQGGHFWVRPWFLHQHCHHWPTGVGSRPAACMSLSGQRYLKHPRSTRILFLANARKAAWKSVSARRPDQAHHCVLATGSALRTELACLRWKFWTRVTTLLWKSISMSFPWLSRTNQNTFPWPIGTTFFPK